MYVDMKARVPNVASNNVDHLRWLGPTFAGLHEALYIYAVVTFELHIVASLASHAFITYADAGLYTHEEFITLSFLIQVL